MNRSLILACLVLASAGVAAAPEPKTNEALSACVAEAVPRLDDRERSLDDVVETIWTACDGDRAQAVIDNPTMADILKLRMRAMLTRHRNATRTFPAKPG